MMGNEMNLILPGNPRYQPTALQKVFGYDNLYRAVGEIELANLRVLAEVGIIPAEDIEELTPETVKKVLDITTTEVDEIERNITKHDIRAWVRRAQEILPPSLGRWVHIPLTSYDALDTARSLQFARVHKLVLKPTIKELVGDWIDLVRRYADQVQIGRTHLQHALPVTVGFWLATILERILYNAQEMERNADRLVGKISGAVGAYNAQVGLGIYKLCGNKSFEERVLEKVGLKPARISTQILPPEPLAYFLHSCLMLSATLGQFGRDARYLMASDIAEVAEAFERGQVGSSTMAHKRNPINFENLEGMWLRTKNEYGKVLDTSVTTLQRDLVGSSVARDFPIIVVNLTQQLNTLLRKKDGVSFLARISVSPEACQDNFQKSAHTILAEPVYIALQMAGYRGDAHDLVNKNAVPVASKEGKPLIEVVEEMAKDDPELEKAISSIPPEIIRLLHSPEQYTGHAQKKASEIADIAEAYIGLG
jgi:adenylosuccinate lyase